MSIATTILEQLGGNKFVVMTGAKQFLGSPDGLRFRIPLQRGRVPNIVNIKLDRATDTYSVEFEYVRGSTYEVVSSHELVYAEDLRGLFERETGLRTSMTRSFA